MLNHICTIDLEVAAVLLNGLIFPFGGVALKRVCTSSLNSSLVLSAGKMFRMGLDH